MGTDVPSTKDEPVWPSAARMVAPSWRQPRKASGTVWADVYVSALNQPRLALPPVAVNLHQPEALSGTSASSRSESPATLSANQEMALLATEPPISPGAQPAAERLFVLE